MKKVFKWIGIVLLSPVVLFIILAALIYVPPIQNWVVQQVTAYASEASGMNIRVEHVDMDFPLDLGIDGILITKPRLEPQSSDQSLQPSDLSLQDTIADIRRAVADVRLWPLLDGVVVLNALELHDAKLNTIDFIGDFRLLGTIGSLSFSSPGIDLEKMTVELRKPRISDTDLMVFMSDTAALDTSTTGWRIRFDQFRLEHTQVGIVIDSAALFPDTATHIKAYMGKASLKDADLDLGLKRFIFGPIDWQEGSMSYNQLLSLSHVSLGLDSLYSYSGELRTGIRHGSLCEDSLRLQLTTLQGTLAMNGDAVSLHNVEVSTPHSVLKAHADFNLADDISLQLDAHIGKHDLLLAAPLLTDVGQQPALEQLPDLPLTLRCHLDGTTTQLEVKQLNISLPTVLHAEASGRMGNLTDPDYLTAQLDLEANAYNTDFLRPLSGLSSDYSIPPGIRLKGSLKASNQRYTANLLMAEGSGTARLSGSFSPHDNSYTADMTIDRLNLRHFMPHDSLGLLSASVRISGQGTDFFSPSTQLEAEARLLQLQYGHLQLDSMMATAMLSDGHTLISAKSINSLLTGSIDMNAQLAKDRIQAKITTDLSSIDLQALGFDAAPLTIGLSGTVSVESDLKMTHYLSGLVENIYIRDSIDTYHPEKLGVLVKTRIDTTVVRIQSGDLIMKLDASENYEQLLTSVNAIADSIGSQIKNRAIDQPLLKRMLPTAKLYVTSQRNNPLANLLRASAGLDFKDLHIDLTTSPENGLNGDARLFAVNNGSVRIDTIRLSLVERAKGLSFNGQVSNSRKNPIGTFNTLFDGQLQEHGASIGVRYFDAQGQRNIRIGTKAEMVDEGLRFQLIPSRPTLGYREFVVNDDNFLLLHQNLKLEANVDLKADDGTHIIVYSGNPGEIGDSIDDTSTEEALLQDLTISVHQLSLTKLTDNMPLLPDIDGVLNGDFHLMRDADRNLSLVSDIKIDSMAYENSFIGNLGSEFVYLLRDDGTHVVDATLTLADELIGQLQGSYLSGKRLDATMELDRLPLSIANGFIPEQLFGFEGFADGTLSIKGALSKLEANGEVRLTDGYLTSTPYGMRMRFDNTPVLIDNSKLTLDNFALYAYNDNPLNISGTVDFNGIGDQAIALRLGARNFQLINAKQKKESVAYGKMFVNFFARLTGSLAQMKLRGRLDVLGSTDLNYILLDSPLSTDNQMEGLVRFTDFSDTTQTVVQRPESDALDLDVTLSVDQGAHVKCLLNAEQTNYVDLRGGGELRMRMGDDGLDLRGRYTVESGTMKYSLPVIPLKTFTIQQGSYVEFTGSPGNPTLSLTATERKRAAVGNEGSQSRSVVFECGVVVTQTLENMGLQFIISSPEDTQVQSELSAMDTEERGKVAVTMLTTGMYLADGNTGGFSMNSALSSFLQNEISNITAGALKTIDLELGLDNSTDASGQMHTDYSFKFSKRFWNNRLNVQIGGKVSTGSEIQGQNQSFFDNVTMEYRLSPTSNQYVKAFYRQNVYDWLEGYTSEYGGGYLWKRKLDSLFDIFRRQSTVTNRERMNRATTQTRDSARTTQTVDSARTRQTVDSARTTKTQ